MTRDARSFFFYATEVTIGKGALLCLNCQNDVRSDDSQD